MEKKEFWSGVVVGIAIALLSVFIVIWMIRPSGHLAGDRKYLEKLDFLESIIDRYYLWDKDESMLEECSYKGMVAGLGDPYSCYYSKEEYEEISMENDGVKYGLGILMEKMEDGTVWVRECYEGGKAESAGICVDDELVSVDEIIAKDASLSELSDYITGHEGELTIQLRRNGEPLEVRIEAGEWDIPSVQYEMLESGIGYLRITEFNGNTLQQYQNGMEQLKAQGMRKIIFDLRNNPGGMLGSVCDILDEILSEGIIVSEKNRSGETVEEKATEEKRLDIPIVVLINENSASAAEIFAGAIRDHKVGTLVGKKTFGKGIVQSIREFTDGSAMKITNAEYYTPAGENIHGMGIEPDLEVEATEENASDPEKDLQLEKAIELIRGFR